VCGGWHIHVREMHTLPTKSSARFYKHENPNDELSFLVMHTTNMVPISTNITPYLAAQIVHINQFFM